MVCRGCAEGVRGGMEQSSTGAFGAGVFASPLPDVATVSWSQLNHVQHHLSPQDPTRWLAERWRSPFDWQGAQWRTNAMLQ